ncbi:MAG TPA: DNA polymerase IV [Candidatus Hydrogenedentes bacterium]|nr:DNA polymerase IV [Candidatus Hydrogenedentota bacterium]
MEIRILHIDMDAFFASVEEVRDPSLRGKPLIIGGDVNSSRGVVSTASYEARKYGVHSAMPMAQARKLCPNGIYIRGHFELYQEASQKVHAILETVSPLVQMSSIDEAYVDVTGSQTLFGGDDAIARYIKSTIRRETGLPCTIAIAPNKLVAKMATEEGKPDGYVRVLNGREEAYLAPLPVRKLPGAGPRTCEMLESLGILTLGQLAAMPSAMLERLFGMYSATWLQRAARGIGETEVVPESIPKSISRETTFEEDILDWPRIERTLAHLAEHCAHTLREQGMEAKRVMLKVRYSDFETKTFAKTLEEPTCIDADLFDALRTLIPKGKERRARVRLIGVGLSSLTYNQHQLRLFDGARTEKWERVLESADRLRDKLGFDSVRCGKSLAPGLKESRAKESKPRDNRKQHGKNIRE